MTNNSLDIDLNSCKRCPFGDFYFWVSSDTVLERK